MEHSFSISDALKFGWHTLKSRSALIYQVLLTVFGVQVAYAIVHKVLAHTALGFLAMVVLLVVSIVLGVGATLISLKLAQHEHTSYSDIVPSMKLFCRYIAVNILVVIIIFLSVAVATLVAFVGDIVLPQTAGGVFFFICILVGVVAAVYFAMRYFLIKYAVLDGHDIIGSLRLSAKLTEGQKWHLVLFTLTLVAINILGAILFLVGLLVSIPISMLAAAHVYVQLKR